MSLFDQVMDRVFSAVRADRLPVAYQFSAARMVEERNVRTVAEWLEEASEEHIREVLEHIVWAGSWCEEGAVIRAIRRVQQETAMATCVKCRCDDLHACPEGCSWLRLDRKTGLGLCSACSHRLADWDAGDRTLAGCSPGHGSGDGFCDARTLPVSGVNL